MAKLLIYKELRPIVKGLKKRGYSVEREDGGHLKVRRGGKVVYALPTTPGSGRWRQNLMAEIRRWELDESTAAASN